MEEVRFITGEAALRNFMEGLREEVDDQIHARNISASGALMNSNRTEVTVGKASATGTFYALDYWTKAGSGSPPGTRVELSALAKWARDKGIASNNRRAVRIGFLVQRKILREGSYQYRNKGTNVYTKAIEDHQPKVEGVLSAFLSDWPTAVKGVFSRAFKAA